MNANHGWKYWMQIMNVNSECQLRMQIMSANNMAIAIPENFDNLSDEQLMNLTGQGLVGGDSSSVLSRLSINYQAEDENDKKNKSKKSREVMK